MPHLPDLSTYVVLQNDRNLRFYILWDHVGMIWLLWPSLPCLLGEVVGGSINWHVCGSFTCISLDLPLYKILGWYMVVGATSFFCNLDTNSIVSLMCLWVSFTLLWSIHIEILAACLGLQCLPADDWHCPHCKDKFGPGRKAAGESRPIILRLKRVVKAPEFEPGGCILCRSVAAVAVSLYCLLSFCICFLCIWIVNSLLQNSFFREWMSSFQFLIIFSNTSTF